jgi:parafibromin
MNPKDQKKREYQIKKEIARLQAQGTEVRKVKGDPIIIVPASLSSMITIHNAKDLLQNGQFVGTADIKKQGRGVKKGTKVTVTHPTQSRSDYSVPQTFEVVDNCRKFTSKEWARVVCVFTDGQAWQFKDWKYSTPLEAFAPQHSLGIHLFLDDRPIEPIIKTWNVERLAISNKKRHLDRILYADFWRLLDEYLIVRRREFVTDMRKSSGS